MFGIGKKKKEELETAVEVSDGSENATTYDPTVEAPEELKVDVTTHKESQEAQEEQKSHEPPPLTQREAKALKRAKYQEKIANNPKFKNIYVLLNKRTGICYCFFPI